MGYIDGYYKEALNRLPRSLIPRVLDAGFCFGFLDPVSNIITNTAAAAYPPSPEANRDEQAGRLRWANKRKRSQSVTKKGRKKKKGRKIIAARSLRGLEAFLTSFFRYLTTQEALRYLRLAKADLLVAVHLIEEDRHTEAFTIHLLTTKVALTCAAISAISSEEFSGSVDEVFTLLAMQGGRLDTSTLRRLSDLSMKDMHGTADPREPMRRAISRFLAFPPHTKKMSVTFDLELALIQVLLERIHGFYLEAMSSFPATSLRLRHHRGLLKAGHCYGPFDPVSNIILNTIWYDTMFPPHHEFKVDMICDEILASTECRSLHGLVTFIQKLFPALSSYDATRYLLFCDARLDKVILRATQEGYHAAIPLKDAYEAAALVAHHPNPSALAKFATVLLPAEETKLKSLLKDKLILSPCDLQSIAATLSQNDPPSKSLVRVQELTLHANMIVSAKRKEFEALQSSVCHRVQAALKKHAHKEGVEYELLAICGVNAQVSEPGKFGYFDKCDGYPYSHVNILARQKGSWLSDAPTLLFIQCSNDSENKEDIPLCLPVSKSSKDAGRCFHCECEGAKIVHPSSLAYLGQESDFEQMARGDHPLSNEELIGYWGQKTVFLDTSEDYCT
ncbi:hypothetical protein HU200_049572 [Digitaria exilis]|uniref:Uncharacterized protein n=1 Tax=Digitaria exilis TaxID=1010633 RepID=A0A835B4B0_9POAL|nr:hypothetical protein HU200_049572 [Digitaria exilis]